MTKSLDQQLIEAVYNKDYDTVRDCIRQGADANFVAPEPVDDSPVIINGAVNHTVAYHVAGQTPLYVAVTRGEGRNGCGGTPKIVEILLKEGHADPNKLPPGGLYPLGIAVDSCATDECTILLLQHGANPNTHSKYGGKTPLMDRASMGHQYEIVKLMLEKGADVKAVDNEGKTAVDYAQKRLEGFNLSGLFQGVAQYGLLAVAGLPEEIKDGLETKKTIALLQKVMKKAP